MMRSSLASAVLFMIPLSFNILIESVINVESNGLLLNTYNVYRFLLAVFVNTGLLHCTDFSGYCVDSPGGWIELSES